MDERSPREITELPSAAGWTLAERLIREHVPSVAAKWHVDRDDLMQEVRAVLAGKPESADAFLAKLPSPIGWLRVTAKNKARELCTKNRRCFQQFAEEYDDPLDFRTEHQMVSFLRELIAALPPPKHKIFQMLADGYSAREVADELELSENTVYSIIRRTKPELEDRIGRWRSDG